MSMLTVGFLVAQTTDGGASGRACAVVEASTSTAPWTACAPLFSSTLSFPVEIICFLKRAPEQTQVKPLANRLFFSSLSLALRHKAGGVGVGLPTAPACLRKGSLGEGHLRNARQLLLLHLLTAGRAGALPALRESRPPPPGQGG